MVQKFLAGCSAAVLCAAALLPFSAAASDAIVWEKSDMLYEAIKDSDGNTTLKPFSDKLITGRFAITIHDTPVHMTLTLYSAEAPQVYYDVDLEPVEGEEETEYLFLTNYSECPQDPDDFAIVYTAPYFQNTYSSAYTITLSSLDTDDAVYEESGLIVGEPGVEGNLSDTTTYAYDVTSVEDLGANFVVSDQETATEEGSLTVSRALQLNWKPYTLGDLNDDAVRDTNDAYLILLYYAKTSLGDTLEGVNPLAADVNSDGAVNADDAYLVLKYYAMTSVGEDMTFEAFLAENA